LGKDTNTIRKNKEALLQASWDVGLKAYTENTKYMFMSHHQNAAQNHDLLITNISFKNVANFKYLRPTVTNESCICDEIKSRLNLGNTCYHSESLLSSHLLSKDLRD
jgi:hypothetical protein